MLDNFHILNLYSKQLKYLNNVVITSHKRVRKNEGKKDRKGEIEIEKRERVKMR